MEVQEHQQVITLLRKYKNYYAQIKKIQMKGLPQERGGLTFYTNNSGVKADVEETIPYEPQLCKDCQRRDLKLLDFGFIYRKEDTDWISLILDRVKVE